MEMRASILNWRRALAAVAALLGAWPACAAIVITNVMTVNVTPSGFSVVAEVAPAVSTVTTVTVSVYSDPGGATNLTGLVGTELYPLNSGDPGASNEYARLQSKALLRRDSMGLGLLDARVTLCAPATTYYYRLTVSNPNGQSAVWPPSGLQAVTTAMENSFVVDSEQLVVTLNDAFPPGAIITLSNQNSSSILAAVVGDGAGANQAFFNVNDLIALSGGTNYAPGGSQLFTASVLGASGPGLTQTYVLIFSNNFTVGQASGLTIGALTAAIGVGTTTMRAGQTASVPITLNSQSPLVGLSFTLNFPTNLFSAISAQPVSPAVGAASLKVLSPTSVRLTFSAAPGMDLQGNQQIAQLNFTAVSNQPSAFVPLAADLPLGTNATPAVTNAFSLQSGRVIIVGPQPLLDMQLVGGSRNLVLYGIPGGSYQIQSSTNVGLDGAWRNFTRVPMTNLSQVFPNLDPAQSSVFFRAYQFTADPPILDASLPANRTVVAYGTPGTNYTLEVATNLSAVLPWHPLLNYTLSNSFQVFTNLGPGSPVFYRLKRP